MAKGGDAGVVVRDGPPPAAGVELRARDLLILATVLALATAFVELALLAVASFRLHKFTHLNPQMVWLTPLGYTILFLIVTGLVLLLGWRASSRTQLRVLALLCMWLGGAGVLFLHQRLHKGASLLVAAGLAWQLSLLVVRRAPFFLRLARRALLPMVSLVLLLFAGLNGRWILQERRALAALPEAPQGAPNVLLIIWDTVRAASLSLYGYERLTTPTLERLAADGITFDRAYATAPWTTPSHASIFTGHFASDLSTDWAAPLNREPRTLAEVLAARGYRTAGITANVFATSRESGLNRGFAHYDDYHVFSPGELLRATSLVRAVVMRERWRHRLHLDQPLGRKHAPQVEREFLTWLARSSDRPFFAFLNFFDGHGPYLPPSPFDTLFGPLLPGRDPQLPEGRTYSPREAQAELDAYEGGIAYLDHRLGVLLEELERRGQLRNTLVIITADHGEEFGEHGVYTHGHSLYERVLHVPLLLYYPARLPRGVRVDSWVSLRDIPATVLDVLGLDHAEAMPGRSLTAMLDRAHHGADTLVSAVNRASGNPPEYPVSKGDMRALYADPWKLIRNGDGRVEIYDLHIDPAESTDLAASPTAAEAKARLEATLQRLAPARTPHPRRR
jgi:arylsulfatase A-like enzyme